MTKKPLDYFLCKMASWKKVLQLLEKYLNKYGNWSYIYEFDQGSIHIQIISNICKKKKGRRKKK